MSRPTILSDSPGIFDNHAQTNRINFNFGLPIWTSDGGLWWSADGGLWWSAVFSFKSGFFVWLFYILFCFRVFVLWTFSCLFLFLFLFCFVFVCLFFFCLFCFFVLFLVFFLFLVFLFFVCLFCHGRNYHHVPISNKLKIKDLAGSIYTFSSSDVIPIFRSSVSSIIFSHYLTLKWAQSDCLRFFTNFLRFWYQKKALSHWQMYRLEDMENMTRCDNHN